MNCQSLKRSKKTGTKKHRHKNGAVQKPSFVFPPFQPREAQTFLSVPSRLFSLPTACPGFSLGKTARRELVFNCGYYIRDLIARQIPCNRHRHRSNRQVSQTIMFLLISFRLGEPLWELQPLPPPPLPPSLLLSPLSSPLPFPQVAD